MEFKEPFKVYTASSNVEAQLIVQMLAANEIAAFADEDHSGVSLWALGTISQFHQPNVWVECSSAEQAAVLIQQFEENKSSRAQRVESAGEISVHCEECDNSSTFPDSQNGTTQNCPRCGAYIDVGEVEWDDLFNEPLS